MVLLLTFVRIVDMGNDRKPKAKVGRPPTERGAYNPNQNRFFGRIDDERWAELREACESADMSMIEWALPVLLRKARREKRKRESRG